MMRVLLAHLQRLPAGLLNIAVGEDQIGGGPGHSDTSQLGLKVIVSPIIALAGTLALMMERSFNPARAQRPTVKIGMPCNAVSVRRVKVRIHQPSVGEQHHRTRRRSFERIQNSPHSPGQVAGISHRRQRSCGLHYCGLDSCRQRFVRILLPVDPNRGGLVRYPEQLKRCVRPQPFEQAVDRSSTADSLVCIRDKDCSGRQAARTFSSLRYKRRSLSNRAFSASAAAERAFSPIVFQPDLTVDPRWNCDHVSERFLQLTHARDCGNSCCRVACGRLKSGDGFVELRVCRIDSPTRKPRVVSSARARFTSSA